MGDTDCTRQIGRWFSEFLPNSYMIYGPDDWQRCFLAAADQQLGRPADLSMPESAATADVRVGLLSRGLIHVGDQKRVREDAAKTLDLAVQESNKDLSCERAALRLAAVEWLARAGVVADEGKNPFLGQSEIAASPSAGDSERQAAESAQVLRAQEPQESRKGPIGRKPVRRNQKYRLIDGALQGIAESRPRTQEEVFQALEGRHVVIPPAEPFMAGRGWIAGFRRDPAAARAWLSKRWAELSLSPLPRGPKNPKK